MWWRLVPLATLCLMGMGCSALLPSSREVVESPWESYRDAQLTFDKIIPGHTTEIELRHLQLDPDTHPNIAILNYSDVLARFLPNSSVSMEDLDLGVRECITAKVKCKGFQVSQARVHKRRNGNFFFDVLGFNRETHITGWKFNGLILLKDGVVIYKLTGGTPSIAEIEEQSNPLGPVQTIGQKLLGF